MKVQWLSYTFMDRPFWSVAICRSKRGDWSGYKLAVVKSCSLRISHRWLLTCKALTCASSLGLHDWHILPATTSVDPLCQVLAAAVLVCMPLQTLNAGYSFAHKPLESNYFEFEALVAHILFSSKYLLQYCQVVSLCGHLLALCDLCPPVTSDPNIGQTHWTTDLPLQQWAISVSVYCTFLKSLLEAWLTSDLSMWRTYHMMADVKSSYLLLLFLCN